MARPVRTIPLSSVSVSPPIPLNNYADPFNVGLGVKLSAGADLTYIVQHTFDNVFAPDFNPSTAVWYTSTFGGNVTPKTTNADGNYAFPVVATRLSVTIWTSGTATLTVIQAGY
jgi:hypothetical protein